MFEASKKLYGRCMGRVGCIVVFDDGRCMVMSGETLAVVDVII